MDQVYKYILRDFLSKLQRNSVQLILEFDKDYVEADGVKCSGYFDDKQKILACAVGNKKVEDWFSTFVHEFCHFEQWLENCIPWQNYKNSNDELFFKYLEGEDVEGAENTCKFTALVELDCEKRVVEKLKKYSDLNSVNIKEYIQKANAYVASYKKMFENRKWYDIERAPYQNKALYTQMPTKFLEESAYFEKFKFNYINWTI